MSSGPHYCRHDSSQLCKVDIYDVKAKEDMGHAWVCPTCDERTVGYGDPGEYNGIPLSKRTATGTKETPCQT